MPALGELSVPEHTQPQGGVVERDRDAALGSASPHPPTQGVSGDFFQR